MDKKKILLIGGLHRSGTSMLFKILGQSPHASRHTNTNKSEDEGQHIQSVYPPDGRFGHMGTCMIPQYHYIETCPLITEYNKRKIIDEWSRYWDTSKDILIEKSPANLIHMRFLQKLIDNSYFIVIIRHPLVVSRAGMRFFRNQRLENHIKHWINAHAMMLEDSKYVKRLVIFRYEDFCQDPKRIIKSIEELLGEKLEIDSKELEIIKSSNHKYYQESVSNDIIDKYEKIINNFGYSFLTPDGLI